MDFSIIKEVREAAEFLLQLPEKLLRSVMDPQVVFYERRERLRKYRELGELREIAKILQSLYFTKGSMAEWARVIESKRDIEHAERLVREFKTANAGLDDILDTISQSTFSNSLLATEAIIEIRRAKAVYAQLSEANPAELLDGNHLSEICEILDHLMESATETIKKLDEHRKNLDCSYG
jgi:hypothetical protein